MGTNGFRRWFPSHIGGAIIDRTFDPTGQYFLATVFQGRNSEQPGSGLQVYRTGPDETPGSTPVQRIPLPHGVHHVAAS